MYCPQCGTESASGQGFCRSCGANLKVIGKAVTLSEAIARSDRGPMPKIKEMMKNLKLDHVTEEVSSALDQMNTEMVRNLGHHGLAKRLGKKREKTPAERRENYIVNGTISLFWGFGVTIFLYYLSAALVLKLPPELLTKIPFEVDPVVRMLWLIGLIPVSSGVGRILAGLSIRPGNSPSLPAQTSQAAEPTPVQIISAPGLDESPASVTEHTTNILHHALPGRGTREIED